MKNTNTLNPTNILNKIKIPSALCVALLALAFSAPSYAAPLVLQINSSGYNNSSYQNRNHNSPLIGIDRAIQGQDRQIINASRSGQLTPREQQITQSNANHLKSLRARVSWDSRIDRRELMQMTSLVQSNQNTITALIHNRDRTHTSNRSYPNQRSYPNGNSNIYRY